MSNILNDMSWFDVIKSMILVGGFTFGGALVISIFQTLTKDTNLQFLILCLAITWMILSPWTMKKLFSKQPNNGDVNQ